MLKIIFFHIYYIFNLMYLAYKCTFPVICIQHFHVFDNNFMILTKKLKYISDMIRVDIFEVKNNFIDLKNFLNHELFFVYNTIRMLSINCFNFILMCLQHLDTYLQENHIFIFKFIMNCSFFKISIYILVIFIFLIIIKLIFLSLKLVILKKLNYDFINIKKIYFMNKINFLINKMDHLFKDIFFIKLFLINNHHELKSIYKNISYLNIKKILLGTGFVIMLLISIYLFIIGFQVGFFLFKIESNFYINSQIHFIKFLYLIFFLYLLMFYIFIHSIFGFYNIFYDYLKEKAFILLLLFCLINYILIINFLIDINFVTIFDILEKYLIIFKNNFSFINSIFIILKHMIKILFILVYFITLIIYKIIIIIILWVHFYCTYLMYFIDVIITSFWFIFYILDQTIFGYINNLIELIRNKH